MKTILQMEHISKQFPGVLALDNVSLSVYEGEVLSIVGSNGAGKSTLMKILSGAYSATTYTGKVIIDGKEARLLTPVDAEKAGVAMIYQEISLMLDMSIAENIFMGKLPLKKNKILDTDKLYSDAEVLLGRVGLDLDPRAHVRSLSTSQQQMLNIAKALAKDPKILVLDEPTSTLTETEVKYLFDVIDNLKKSGVSCIYISHKLDEVFTLSDRIVIMRDGKVQGTIAKEEVDPGKVINMMIGRSFTSFERTKSNIIEDKVMLEVKNYKVRHPFVPNRNILEDVSFSLRAGEILGLVGLVGSGRSELVSSLFGYKNKTAGGDVLIEGQKVEVKSPAQAKEMGLGLLTEDRKLNGFVGVMDIKENITLPNLGQISRKGLISASFEKSQAQKYFDIMSIKAPSIKTVASTLSGGNQQKVVLSKWLMSNPKILFLDEPTRGIDVGAKFEIYKLIEELAYQGMAIVVISSEWEELMNLCDRFVVISRGKSVADLKRGEIDEVTANKLIAGL